MPQPPDAALAEIFSDYSNVTRRLEILEEDNQTVFSSSPGFLEGSVTIDQSRDERRMLDLVIWDTEDEIEVGPGALWYDKVIRPYRGVTWAEDSWEALLGCFIIDRIQVEDFPTRRISLSGRDFTKRALNSQFTQTTTFVAGTPVDDIVGYVANNAGITDQMLSGEGKVTGKEFTFDPGTARWQVIKDICTAYSFEVFLDPRGFLVMRNFHDPVLTPASMVMDTSGSTGLIGFQKSYSDARLYNHVAVNGESTGAFAEVRNTNSDSATSVQQIGERTYRYSSPFIETDAQALEVAQDFLSIHALEEYEINFDTRAIPSMEVGEVLEFTDPDPAILQPERFLISTGSIPLSLAPMSMNAKRVAIVS